MPPRGSSEICGDELGCQVGPGAKLAFGEQRGYASCIVRDIPTHFPLCHTTRDLPARHSQWQIIIIGQFRMILTLCLFHM